MKKYIVTVRDRTTFWFNESMDFHREEGPAIQWGNGDRSWWINGELHREDGPAIENSDGSRIWYVNGKLHREGGPAYENFDGTRQWFIDGREYTEEQFIARTKKELTISEIESLLGYSVKIIKG